MDHPHGRVKSVIRLSEEVRFVLELRQDGAFAQIVARPLPVDEFVTEKGNTVNLDDRTLLREHRVISDRVHQVVIDRHDHSCVMHVKNGRCPIKKLAPCLPVIRLKSQLRLKRWLRRSLNLYLKFADVSGSGINRRSDQFALIDFSVPCRKVRLVCR